MEVQVLFRAYSKALDADKEVWQQPFDARKLISARGKETVGTPTSVQDSSYAAVAARDDKLSQELSILLAEDETKTLV